VRGEKALSQISYEQIIIAFVYIIPTMAHGSCSEGNNRGVK